MTRWIAGWLCWINRSHDETELDANSRLSPSMFIFTSLAHATNMTLRVDQQGDSVAPAITFSLHSPVAEISWDSAQQRRRGTMECQDRGAEQEKAINNRKGGAYIAAAPHVSLCEQILTPFAMSSATSASTLVADDVAAPMLTRPPPSAIARVSAASITPAEFTQRFVQANQPVIVENALHSWTDALQQARASAAAAAAQAQDPAATAPADAPSDSSAAAASWSISQLSELLGSTPMRNVFVSSSQNQRRFKFFKQPRPAGAAISAAAAASTSAVEASSSSAANVAQSVPSQVDPGLSRLSMPFDQFVALTTTSTCTDAAATVEQAERPGYYVSDHSQRTLHVHAIVSVNGFFSRMFRRVLVCLLHSSTASQCRQCCCLSFPRCPSSVTFT